MSKVQQLARDPASLANNVKRMQGVGGLWRLRVGSWRVIYTDEGLVLLFSRSRREARHMIEV